MRLLPIQIAQVQAANERRKAQRALLVRELAQWAALFECELHDGGYVAYGAAANIAALLKRAWGFIGGPLETLACAAELEAALRHDDEEP